MKEIILFMILNMKKQKILIRKTLKKSQKTVENEDFIFSTQKLLIVPGGKYDFSFYLLIFLECYSTKYVQRLLTIFTKDKIGEVGTCLEENERKVKLNALTKLLQKYEDKPEELLEKIEEKKREEYGKYLVGIILFFTYSFKRERMQEVINKEKLQIYMDKALLEYKDFFKEINLAKERISNLINISQNLKEIVNSLKYCNSVLDLIESILDDSNFDKIWDICQSEIDDKKQPTIDIEKIVDIKEDDNIKEISGKYKILFNKQKEIKYFFIKFEPALCEKYISLFEGKNIGNLLYIKDIIDLHQNYEIKVNINEIIHDTGMKLYKEKKLKNSDLLNFIRKDFYFNDSKYFGNKRYRPIEILNGFEFDSFDDNLFFEWKKLEWKKIFDEYNFLDKIFNSINDMAHFNILFKLLDISKNSEEQDFSEKSLIKMQKKFSELMAKPEKPNNEDLIKLIIYSDKKKADIDFFLKSLQRSLSSEKVNEIYINIMSLHKDSISSDSKNIIAAFFTTNSINSIPENLLKLMKSCPELISYIFDNLNHYNIKKEDFFSLEETNSLKLYKAFLDENYIENSEYKNTSYIKNALNTIKELGCNIERGEKIKYEDINQFSEVNGKKK